MQKLTMLAAILFILVGCDDRNNNEVTAVSGLNQGKLTHYQKPQNRVFEFGDHKTQTNLECKKERDKGITLVAYQFAENNPREIQQAWQFFDKHINANYDFVVELKSEVEDKVPPFMYFDGQRVYQTDEEVPCYLLYQRNDDWLKGSIACMTLVSGDESPIFISATFECRPQASLSFEINEFTLKKLIAAP